MLLTERLLPRMIPEGRQPTLELFPFAESSISGQDIRSKRRYIV